MRKFLLPIINTINLILVSVAWILSAGKTNDSAIVDAGKGDVGCGNLYQLVWGGSKGNSLAIVAFFLFIAGCALILAAFLPVKVRKYISCAGAATLIASGILFLLSPKTYDYAIVEAKLTGRFIAFCVLVLIAGAFLAAMAAIEFLGKKKESK